MLQPSTTREESGAKIIELWKPARKGITFLSLLCCQALFKPCKTVAQSVQISKASALEYANVIKEGIVALWDVENMEQMGHKVEAHASKMDLKMPDSTKRVSRTQRHFCQPMQSEAVTYSTATVTLSFTRQLTYSGCKRKKEQPIWTPSSLVRSWTMATSISSWWYHEGVSMQHSKRCNVTSV